MKFCGKCGAELVEGDVFCIHCGARIADYNVDDAANQTVSNEADGNPINEQNIGSQQNQQTQGQTYAPGYQSAPVQTPEDIIVTVPSSHFHSNVRVITHIRDSSFTGSKILKLL